MVSNLEIHFWNIQGYVNLNINTKQLILQKILANNSVNNFSRKLKISNVSLGHFLNNKNSFIRITNLIEIISNLHISKYLIERNVNGYKDTSSKEPFLIKFPYILSPLEIRIGGVLLGDGNIHKTSGMLRWIQKDVSPLKNLVENLFGIRLASHTLNKQITIPAFIGKILSYSLNLKLNQLNSEEFIEKCLYLPRDYSLALLIAIIEDEGNIDSKNFGTIDIRMSSKRKIFMIKQLCSFLGYETSGIRKYLNKGDFGKNMMYRIGILSGGIKKLGYDMLKLKETYGEEIGFWKKEDNFIRRWKTCISKKAEKNREGIKIHNNIKKLFLKYRNLSPLKISVILKIDYNRVYDLIKNMNRRGEIIRVRQGIYSLA